MGKEVKTNAIRILDKEKVNYTINTYECDEFIDAKHVADMLSQPYESSYKTLVVKGKSGDYFVFLVPIVEELDMKKAAKSVSQKSVELIAVKDINNVTGYIRGGCTPIGMKKKYKTVIDSSAQNFDTIIISGGRIGTQIFMSPHDLSVLVDAEFYDIIKEV